MKVIKDRLPSAGQNNIEKKEQSPLSAPVSDTKSPEVSSNPGSRGTNPPRRPTGERRIVREW